MREMKERENRGREKERAGQERAQQGVVFKKETRCISSLIIDVVFIFCSFTLPSLIHKWNIY